MKIFIETKQFILREFIMEDVDGMFLMDSDPDVHTYLGNNPVQNKDQIRNAIERVQQQYKDNGIGRWSIIEKSSNEFVGWTGLKYEKELRPDRNYYDLGYRLRKKYWGRGIASETAKLSLKYGFENMNLKQICACADVNHGASNKILKRVGLQFVETFYYEESLCNWYELSQSDWKKFVEE